MPLLLVVEVQMGTPETPLQPRNSLPFLHCVAAAQLLLGNQNQSLQPVTSFIFIFLVQWHKRPKVAARYHLSI